MGGKARGKMCVLEGFRWLKCLLPLYIYNGKEFSLSISLSISQR